jgi:hypothetical protein
MFTIHNMEGQKTGYEDQNKIIYVTINEPFYSAGKLLHWPESSTVGLGFNHTIIDVLLKLKADLVVRVGTTNSSYWVSYDRVKKFVKEHQTQYTVSGKTLTVLSWKIFVRVGEHQEL